MMTIVLMQLCEAQSVNHKNVNSFTAIAACMHSIK